MRFRRLAFASLAAATLCSLCAVAGTRALHPPVERKTTIEWLPRDEWGFGEERHHAEGWNGPADWEDSKFGCFQIEHTTIVNFMPDEGQ